MFADAARRSGEPLMLAKGYHICGQLVKVREYLEPLFTSEQAPWAYLELAELLLSENANDAAAGAVHDAIRHADDATRALVAGLGGQLLLLQGNPNEGEVILTRAIEELESKLADPTARNCQQLAIVVLAGRFRETGRAAQADQLEKRLPGFHPGPGA
jgi:predicted Zn-dependent protease